MLLKPLLPPGLVRERTLIRKAWTTAIALSVMVNVLILVQPVFMLHVYDYVLPSQNLVTLALLTTIALFVVCASALMDYLRSRVLIDIGRELDVQIRERVFRGAFEQAIVSRRFPRAQFVTDLETLRGFITGPSASALMDLPWTPIYILSLFILSPWLGLLALVFAGAVLVIGLANERMLKPMAARASISSQISARLADDVVRSAPASQSMGFTGALVARWTRAARHAGRLNESLAVDNAKAAATVRSVRLSLQILSLALAAWLVLEQKLSSGGIVAASIIGARAVGPIESCITGWRRFLAARLSLQTLEELAFAADRLEAHRLTLPAPSGAIAMQGVSLVEPDRRAAILSNISFASPAGAFIGVVGRSGSGKSSLLNLLAGAMRPSAGSIRIDGADLDQWRREALGPSIGFLPQSILLHRGTVAENIRRFGEPDDEGVIRAAKLCGAHAMILNLPFGYDTEIGDEGGALSGGQKQRLALARAVYGDPAILLLDEPTAALDGESEEQFWSMIQTLRAAGKTIYLVTHRAGHVQQADFVLVMAEGRVAQFGPAASVLPQLIPAPGGRRAS